jgi:hypothetical protein
MESKLHEVSPYNTQSILLVICKLVPCYLWQFLTVWVLRLPKYCCWDFCSSWNLCSLIGCLLCSVSRPCTGIIFESHSSKQWAKARSDKQQWIYKFLTTLWRSMGNISSQNFSIMHNIFRLWLFLNDSRSSILLSENLCLLITFLFTKYSVFFDHSS